MTEATDRNKNMNLKKAIVLSFATAILSTGLVYGQDTTDLKKAKTWFNELETLCNLDNGQLWGINLYGPTMFVFPENRIIIANEPDNDGKLVQKDGVYVGILPENMNIANTSLDWNGKKWTMVNWGAISENDKYSRDKLLIHESWHRVEDKTGIKSVMTENPYLDQLRGSVLMKLEFMALSQALTADSNDKIAFLRDALTIRAYRQSLFPENNENIFELHEGMPEYTGYKLCGIDNSLLPKVVAKQLDLSMDKEGLTNSFAYLTGPAYGVLFDELNNDWIPKVKEGETLPEIGSSILSEKLPTDTAILHQNVNEIIQQFNAEPFIESETRKFEQQKQLVKAYENKFLNGDVLIIKNNNVQMSFNPQEKLIPVGNGVVYKTMRVSGDWGIAEVSNGIFRSDDWQYFTLPAPATGKTGKISEPDYSLMLNDGWEVLEVKPGKYVLINK